MIKIYYLLPSGDKVDDFSKLSKEDHDLFLVKPSPRKIKDLIEAVLQLTPSGKNRDIIFDVYGNLDISKPF